MPLNDAAMVLAANALRTALAYGQLHSLSAGASGTANVITAVGRAAVSWSTPTDAGNFVLLTPIAFTGGTSGHPVFSVTLWDSGTLGAGNLYGEFVLSFDSTFDASGNYHVTMLDLSGSAG